MSSSIIHHTWSVALFGWQAGRRLALEGQADGKLGGNSINGRFLRAMERALLHTHHNVWCTLWVTNVTHTYLKAYPPHRTLCGAADGTGDQGEHMFFPLLTAIVLLLTFSSKLFFPLPCSSGQPALSSPLLSKYFSLIWEWNRVALLFRLSWSIKEKMRQKGALWVCHHERTVPNRLLSNCSFNILLNCYPVYCKWKRCVCNRKWEYQSKGKQKKSLGGGHHIV